MSNVYACLILNSRQAKKFQTKVLRNFTTFQLMYNLSESLNFQKRYRVKQDERTYDVSSDVVIALLEAKKRYRLRHDSRKHGVHGF